MSSRLSYLGWSFGDMLNVYLSQAHLICSIHLSFPALCQLWRLSQLHQCTVPLQFPLSDVVITMDVTPSHLAFYFLGLGLYLSFSQT